MLVAMTSCVFAWINITNAENFSPQWSQDLAFFHQWVHSAASGGPWASPLILEPQGFFEQVHTHLILPLVVAVYTVAPSQITLLFLHSFFAALTIWPAFRLAEAAAGGLHALIMVAAIVAFGPFLGIAVADFRPVVLFLPGIVGVWSSAYRGSLIGVLAWGLLALAGRQEAAYLLIASGVSMTLCSWGAAGRRIGFSLVIFGTIAFAAFMALKPEMFFHINSAGLSVWPEGTELWSNRAAFGIALAVSFWWIGVLAPAPLVAALPVIWGMLTTTREWHSLAGPGAHHHVFWLPFAIAAAAVAARHLPGILGPTLLLVLGWNAYPHPEIEAPRPELHSLLQSIPSTAKVAADYDTIHRLSGRTVLWNIDQLYMPDRPRHWKGDWPLTLADVDFVVSPVSHPLNARLKAWRLVDQNATHAVHARH